MGSVCIPIGVYSNMQFYIPRNISWPSPWITLQFPIFGNHCLTYYNKQRFCSFTGRQHRTICPFICRYLLRMSPSCGWNLFCAQCCNTAVKLYNKCSDICNTSGTRHYAHSHQIFNVLSQSPAVCYYHFCTSSRQHKWICFLSMSSTTHSYTACPFSGLSPVHRYFHTLVNLFWCIINTNFPKKCTQIIPKGTDRSRFSSLHKGGSDYQDSWSV